MRLRKVFIGRDVYLRPELRLRTQTPGNAHADWTFLPELLNRERVVYSFGVGRDISFDPGLIDEYQLELSAFDPTPDPVSRVSGQKLPEKFHCSPAGIADFDGTTQSFSPERGGSHPFMGGVCKTAPIDVRVQTLRTFMKNLGHTRVDLRKMDIEGAEFPVLEDLLGEEVPVKQLLAAFHHRFQGIGIRKTQEMIGRLRAYGYRVFYVSPSGEEISFVLEAGNN